ncbi:hypothetical protein RIF29_16412 [Crotalaria pallida]|uniref:Uncharacterized protein n=1 Tax=Crotalaria pallida TaxID=3830 RepID=A0AAN9FGG6_CROPI
MTSTFGSSSNGVHRRVCYCGGIPRDNPLAYYFKWVDEDANEASQGQMPSEHDEASHQIPPRNANAAEFGVEYWKIKSKKFQRKLRDEREKSKKLIYVVILTCTVAFDSNILVDVLCHRAATFGSSGCVVAYVGDDLVTGAEVVLETAFLGDDLVTGAEVVLETSFLGDDLVTGLGAVVVDDNLGGLGAGVGAGTASLGDDLVTGAEVVLETAFLGDDLVTGAEVVLETSFLGDDLVTGLGAMVVEDNLGGLGAGVRAGTASLGDVLVTALGASLVIDLVAGGLVISAGVLADFAADLVTGAEVEADLVT